jgi:hypothetical protein
MGLALLLAMPASANGRYPQSNQVLFSPTDPNLVILRTTFGVLFSHDDGATWSWLCEGALGLRPTSSEDPSLGLTADETLVAGVHEGLEISRDMGCTWSFVGGGLENQLIADLAVRANARTALVAVTSTYEPDAGADGGAGYGSQVYASTDNGATWSAQGTAVDPSVIVTTIDVAAGDPHRLYVSGLRVTAAPDGPVPVFLASSDDGAHWVESATFPPLSHETAIYIAAVDPTNPDRVYLRSSGSTADLLSQSRLFVTSDAGKSFEIALVLAGSILGFALSPDGSKVYAGGTDGLFTAARENLGAPNAFRKVSTLVPHCLSTRGAELWACSDEASGFFAGVSTDDGASFAARLHFDGIRAPISCSSDAVAAQCSGLLFEQLCASLGGCARGQAEAGAPGAAAAGQPKGSCGCSVAGGEGAAGLAAGFAVVAMTVRRRARRSKGR